MGLTLDQLQGMGAKPVSSFTPGQMNQMGSKPLGSFFDENPAPTTPSGKLNQSQAALGHSQGVMDQIGNVAKGVGDFASGFAKSAINTGMQTGKLISEAGTHLPGQAGQFFQNELDAGTQEMNRPEFQAQGPAQQLGSAAGDVAQIAEGGVGLYKGALTAAKIIPATMDAIKTEGIGGLLSKGFQGAKTAIQDAQVARNVKAASNTVASTAETMTKGEREAAIAEGRLKPNLLGGGTYEPSATEQNAGRILSEKITHNPVKDVPIIQNEIATRGKAAETFLEKNAQPMLTSEDGPAFATKRTEIEKNFTPNEMKAYDEQVGLFKKQLGDKFTTSDYYKALKDYESNVTARLPKGKEALLTETGSAKLQAAKDVRNVVRDMLGDRYSEFKPQMYDLTSLYDALDNTISKAEKADTFTKAHPTATKALKYGAEAVGAGAIYEGAKNVGAPLP